ncbi:MAG: hypothetical protein EOP17_00610 [Rhizobiaceae bacterium]|nr:MAG: hypothetical protein EOP17_00610 [Rhizobiaceae bacterium]
MTIETAIRALVGKLVWSKNIPGNTIEIWLDVPPQAADAIVLAVYPPWRIVSSETIIASSADIPWEPQAGESAAEFQALNDEARRTSDVLIGRALTSAVYDPRTSDLTLAFDDKVILQCFTVWRDEPSWSLRLYGENRRIGPGLDEPIQPIH